MPPRRERLKVVTTWACVLNKKDRSAAPSHPHGQMIDTLDDGKKGSVHYPSDQSVPGLTRQLKEHGVQYDSKGVGSSAWWSILTGILPFVLLLGFWIFLMNQVQGGGSKVMSFGKSRAKRMAPDSPKIGFKDVAGVDEAVEELQEIKEFLENPKKFQALGARIPKGVLLYGPPGTGKTLLARAVAGEAGVPFFSISGSDFVEMFVGVGASRVRDLFEQAKQASPCIVFMDEIDAVGRHRGAGLGGGHDEREQTLNQLLVEMDGFDAATSVIVLAATNRPDVLDPALLRPGRFDRQVVVARPDVKGREEILKVHSRRIPLAPNVALNVLARGTSGFSGADLANLVNEAALLAAREGKREITQIELTMKLSGAATTRAPVAAAAREPRRRDAEVHVERGVRAQRHVDVVPLRTVGVEGDRRERTGPAGRARRPRSRFRDLPRPARSCRRPEPGHQRQSRAPLAHAKQDIAAGNTPIHERGFLQVANPVGV